jgi:hypothetical protein
MHDNGLILDQSAASLIGREARQGEVGLVVGDEYFAIRDFGEE